MNRNDPVFVQPTDRNHDPVCDKKERYGRNGRNNPLMEKLISPTKRSKSDISGLDSPHSGPASIQKKFLLLAYAFETLSMVRVQCMTDELNEKSRAAIFCTGAKEEGIIRHERIMADGRKRNNVFFSIIDSEWQELKVRLPQKIVR